MATIEWDQIKSLAISTINNKTLSRDYQDRLEFEISEIEKQGYTSYWSDIVNTKKRYKSSHLVLPWLLGLTDDDPIAQRQLPVLNTVAHNKVKDYINKHGQIPPDFVKDQDMPDIDIDCLPDARGPIKEYAVKKYGNITTGNYGAVCSVGTWQTYKFKLALTDVVKALGSSPSQIAGESVKRPSHQEIVALTNKLPDEVDELKDNGESKCKGSIIDGVTGDKKECGFKHASVECPKCGSADTDGPTIGKILSSDDQEYKGLQQLYDNHPDIIDYAVRLLGKIRNMGMHAGALIIADRDLYGNVPMAKNGKNGYWISMWTEGRNTQLSKFGYNKWDILGLKTLEYIFNCCKLIKENRGISFGDNLEGWDDIDPTDSRAGYYITPDGTKHKIDLNDKDVLALANEQKTDGIFQFDTELAKSILKNGVKNFNDLMLLNALGHPGPMQSIPDIIANRDDRSQSWKKRVHSEALPILESTYGEICYQEQLAAIWQQFADFSSTEAQEARKAVAKKWVDKLRPIKDKWLLGASKKLGKEVAELWWQKQETFGRYAFNKCLDKDTILRDAITNEAMTVEQWRGKELTLPSVDAAMNIVNDRCVDIHDTGIQEILEITFDDGTTERVTASHKFLCSDGEYYEVREIINKGLDVASIGIECQNQTSI